MASVSAMSRSITASKDSEPVMAGPPSSPKLARTAGICSASSTRLEAGAAQVPPLNGLDALDDEPVAGLKHEEFACAGDAPRCVDDDAVGLVNLRFRRIPAHFQDAHSLRVASPRGGS